jgi:hypothetical protein
LVVHQFKLYDLENQKHFKDENYFVLGYLELKKLTNTNPKLKEWMQLFNDGKVNSERADFQPVLEKYEQLNLNKDEKFIAD